MTFKFGDKVICTRDFKPWHDRTNSFSCGQMYETLRVEKNKLIVRCNDKEKEDWWFLENFTSADIWLDEDGNL